jgi:hypothetical protein
MQITKLVLIAAQQSYFRTYSSVVQHNPASATCSQQSTNRRTQYNGAPRMGCWAPGRLASASLQKTFMRMAVSPQQGARARLSQAVTRLNPRQCLLSLDQPGLCRNLSKLKRCRWIRSSMQLGGKLAVSDL